MLIGALLAAVIGVIAPAPQPPAVAQAEIPSVAVTHEAYLPYYGIRPYLPYY